MSKELECVLDYLQIAAFVLCAPCLALFRHAFACVSQAALAASENRFSVAQAFLDHLSTRNRYAILE